MFGTALAGGGSKVEPGEIRRLSLLREAERGVRAPALQTFEVMAE
jgi:hypothetical protein